LLSLDRTQVSDQGCSTVLYRDQDGDHRGVAATTNW
jgi:hypothetical protein